LAEELRLICSAEAVQEAAKGFLFSVERYGRQVPAFVVRFNGVVRAYLNECGHVPAQLDWQPGEFFDHSKLYLICSIHGALYSPESGRCLSGRCQGKGLKPLTVCEIEGQIFLQPENKNG
jgi:nitrite reductase/ring-hydroxylating ferredoxin subunit